MSNIKTVIINEKTKKNTRIKNDNNDNDDIIDSEQVMMSKRKYEQRKKEDNEKFMLYDKERMSLYYNIKMEREQKKAYIEALEKEKNDKNDLMQKVKMLENDIHMQKSRTKYINIDGGNANVIMKSIDDIVKEVDELYNNSGQQEIEKLRKSLGLM
jgi:hypothetical protein